MTDFAMTDFCNVGARIVRQRVRDLGKWVNVAVAALARVLASMGSPWQVWLLHVGGPVSTIGAVSTIGLPVFVAPPIHPHTLFLN